MERIVKAGLGAKVRRNNMIKLTIVATIAIVGIFMAVVSVIGGSYLLAIVYLAAAVLGVLYSIIKINTTLPPGISCDGEKLYMNTWDNNFFPFNINSKPIFFADFIPARTLTYEIELNAIEDMAIGTKGYLSRTLQDAEFDRRVAEVTRKNSRIASLVKRCDILYVRIKGGEIYLMTVNDFDVDELYRIVDMVEHLTHGLEFKTNLRKLRRKREKIQSRQNII